MSTTPTPPVSDSVRVQGPDNRMYRFPKGTTKDQAVAYFKSKGIAGKPSGQQMYDTAVQKSVESQRAQHPVLTKTLGLIPAAAATGMGILGAETGPGAVVAAGAGGMAGKALESSVEEKLGLKSPQTSGTAESSELLKEGGKQAAFEAGGRAVGAVTGRAVDALRGRTPEVVGSTIGGVKVPETMGQSSGRSGGFTQTIEHYLSKTFLGNPLQEVKAAQQASTRQILANLSHTDDAVPGAMAQNWERATQETRITADGMYNAIGEHEAKTSAPVAAEILKDESLRLPGKARDALSKIASDPHMEIAKSLGYKSTEDAKKAVGETVWNQLITAEAKAGHVATVPTVRDALSARSELRDLASTSADRNLRRLYGQAWEKLDASINAGLTSEQKALKADADRLWRRSYIQEEITKGLTAMQNAQAPSAAPMVAVDGFVKMVNKLAHSPLVREGDSVVAKPSKLDILFDNPSDKQAMIQLADFLKTKYTTMGGNAGISESIARIGVALEAMRIPGQIISGAAKSATHGGMSLAALSAMAKVMANPGGVKLLRAYFNSGGAAATALAARIAAQALDQPMPRQPVSHQSY